MDPPVLVVKGVDGKVENSKSYHNGESLKDLRSVYGSNIFLTDLTNGEEILAEGYVMRPNHRYQLMRGQTLSTADSICLDVEVHSQNNVKIVNVPFFRGHTPHDDIVSTLETNPRAKIGRIEYSQFSLRNKASNSLITAFESLSPGIQLTFSLDEKIVPLSASDWDASYIAKLAIDWDDVHTLEDLFEEHVPVSEVAINLVERLASLSRDFIGDYEANRFSAPQDITDLRSRLTNDHKHVLSKSLFLIDKYSNNEALVDNFLVHLLRELGFYDGMMFAVPQLNLDLNFGDTKCSARPDFLLMDILSYCRVSVFEEKNRNLEEYDSEPQMIAEAISAAQLNEKVERNLKKSRTQKAATTNLITDEQVNEKKVSDLTTIYGVRVNGFMFSFYAIPISPSIRTAMSTKTAVHDQTKVKRIWKLDFLRKEHRKQIIFALDKLRSIVESPGISSERLYSK